MRARTHLQNLGGYSGGRRAVEAAISSPLAPAAFFLIFFGFSLYHALVEAGYASLFLGGYSTAIAAMLLPALLVAYTRQVISHSRRLPIIELAFLFFIAYFILVIAIHNSAGTDASYTGPHLAIAVQFLTIFATIRMLDVTTPRFRKLSLMAFIGLTAIAIANFSGASLFSAALDLPADDPNRANYQGYAFVYLVTALFFGVPRRSMAFRLFIYCVATFALFLIGARSEFIAFGMAAPLIEWCYAKRRSLIPLAITACVIVAALSLNTVIAAFPESRVLNLLELGYVGSLAERPQMMARAVITLQNHPVLGDYASYPVGEYAHNALSVWVDLGLVGFILFSTLLLWPLIDLLRQFTQRSREPFYILALVVLGLALVLLVFAKNFTYQIYPVAVALYARDCLRRQYSTVLRAALQQSKQATSGYQGNRLEARPGT